MQSVNLNQFIKMKNRENNQQRYYTDYYNDQILLNLELTRRKRSEINDLINKELRIKHGAINLLKVCYNNEQAEQKLRLEIAFSDSNIKYLKDKLSELNCDLTINKIKMTNNLNQKYTLPSSTGSSSISTSSSSSTVNSPLTTKFKSINLKNFEPLPEITVTQNDSYINDFIPISVPTFNSFSPSSSSTNSTPTTTINSNNNHHHQHHHHHHHHHDSSFKLNKFEFSLDEHQTKSSDIMIYLNLKETMNNINFSAGFSNFIIQHFRLEPACFSEQIKQFNYFRESTIRLSYEPCFDSLNRLFEYFNSLNLIEKRFFQNSQCNNVHFTWFDSINGIESTQKSIQFEKASILFNCAALYTQLAALSCDIKDRKPEDQLEFWLCSAGCLNYLNTNFSNSPSLDMSSFLLYFFTDIFTCQAYEIKCKLLLLTNNESNIYDSKHLFLTYANCSKIYSHLAHKYSQIHVKLLNNQNIKNYLPEIWFYLIKVKSYYFRGLSHYYASLAISSNGLDKVCDCLEIQCLFDNLHDKTRIESPQSSTSTILNAQSNILDPYSTHNHKSYFQKIITEQKLLYNFKVLRSNKRIYLAKLHMRESIIQQEEAIRQHGFCRKFSKEDYLHNLLRYYHEISLDKFMFLENQLTSDLDDELFDLLPINANLSENLTLKPIEPNFQKYQSKDFFNLIGPLKVYSSENNLSIPYSCLLRKLPNQQTYGITVKGDCPVRINHVDPESYAYSAGIREGDFIIAIQDQDVRWSKHTQVVEKIRSQLNSVKLTLISVKTIPKEVPIFCEDNEKNKTKNCSDKVLADSSKEAIFKNAIITPSSKKKILSTNFKTNEPVNKENDIWIPINKQVNLNNTPETPSKSRRFFRLPSSSTNLRTKSPFLRENSLFNSAASKLCNFTKSNNENNINTNKLRNGFNSTHNLYSEKIIFNDKDDEICSRENAIFWENLKTIKTPLTNTITLGRKFKRNVMKLNIFNSFNNSTNSENTNNLENEKLKVNNDLNENEQNAQKITPLPQLPPLPLQGTSVKAAKNKLLKKQKRLKKLDQETDKLLINENALYKTI